MCAGKIKEIHPRVSEISSGNEMQTDIQVDANTPPQLRRAGDKKEGAWGILKGYSGQFGGGGGSTKSAPDT